MGFRCVTHLLHYFSNAELVPNRSSDHCLLDDRLFYPDPQLSFPARPIARVVIGKDTNDVVTRGQVFDIP